MRSVPKSKSSSSALDRRSLWVISWVSFFWSASSLMVLSLLPTFLTDVLKISKTKIGFIEGSAVALAFLSKILTGILSDYWRVRKPLIVIGTVCSIVMKLIFAMAGSTVWVCIARLLDRFSKGIRSSPTDALIADISDESERGHAYGLRQTLYTFGVVAGTLIALFLMYWTNKNYRLIFALSTFLGITGLIILIFGLKKDSTRSHEVASQADSHWTWSHIYLFPKKYWYTLLIVGALMLAHFQEVFLFFRAREMQWQVEWLPLIIILINIVSAAVAYPMGKYSDNNDKITILIYGLVCLLIADAFFILGSGIIACVLSIILRGMHMGLIQGLIRSMVAHAVPFRLRGTAFSLFYLVSGVSVIIGNGLAGILSDTWGTSAAFVASAVFTGLALLLTVRVHYYRIRIYS